MKHIFKQKVKCKKCGGTGIYKGFLEKGRVGVVCRDCEGRGWIEMKFTWEDFEGKEIRDDIDRVVECNPGICINEEERFGGMPYKDWLKGEPFPPRSENRKYTCPCRWYQVADYSKAPRWEECKRIIGRTFQGCPYYEEKEKCWERWDREQTQRKKEDNQGG